MFTVEMLPAAYGDSLWIEYGAPDRPHCVLIDGGLAGTYDSICDNICSYTRRTGAECNFELLVVTHVDADHIEGAVKLLANLPLRTDFKEIWFNGWEQISGRLGAVQGEKLTACIADHYDDRWNKRFAHGPAVVPNEGALPSFELEGGLRLTLLSPTQEQLAALVPKWETECRKAGLVPGSLEDARKALEEDRRIGPQRLGPPNVSALAEEEYEPDDSESNGSSIAFLAEYDNKACLFAGDAFSEVLEGSVKRLLRARGVGRLELDAYKASHHGSRYNNGPGLLDLIESRMYLFSTSGDKHHHPDPQTIARVLKMRKEAGADGQAALCFNYLSDENEIWDSGSLKSKWKYITEYPACEGTAGLALRLG